MTGDGVRVWFLGECPRRASLVTLDSVRRLVQSASYATLLDAATDFLGSLKDHPEMVVLAQTRGAADDFVRSACRAGLLGVHRMTLTGLAVDLAEGPLARAGLTPVGGLSAEAMVARVIHKLKAESIPFGELASHTFPHEIPLSVTPIPSITWRRSAAPGTLPRAVPGQPPALS